MRAIGAVQLLAAGDYDEQRIEEVQKFLEDADWESGRDESIQIVQDAETLCAEPTDWIVRTEDKRLHVCKDSEVQQLYPEMWT